MAKAKVVRTVKPSGLTLTRSDSAFKGAWKIADKDYGDGQIFKYGVDYEAADIKWTKASVSKTAKTKSFTVSESSVYPNGKRLEGVMFFVSGNRKAYTKSGKTIDPIASAASYAEFLFYKPNKPTVSLAFTNYHTSTLTVSTGATTSDHYWIRYIKYQTCLLTNCDITDGAKVTGWGAVQSASGTALTHAFSENTATVSSGSHTRWVKVWCVGALGESDPVYVRHVYAAPNTPTVKEATATKTSGGFNCKVKWSVPISTKYPVDSLSVEYVIANIGATLSGWTDAGASGATGAEGTFSFSVDQSLSDDQALYVRVNAKHDNNTTYGTAYRVAVGVLADPSGLSVTADDTTYQAVVAATNNSSATGTANAGNVAAASAFLAIRYCPASNSNGYDCAVIPSGTSPSQVSVQCPDWSDEDGKLFKVRAVVGSYTKTSVSGQPDRYTITPVAASAWVDDGGTVPSAPGTVELASTDISGTVRVSWEWTWTSATFAEISWADHADAWESTEEPSTYEVAREHVSAWNVSGLETGTIWYFRVRLAKTSGDSTTYGPYSAIQSIDLSSAPVAPAVELSAGAIAEDGDVTVTWSYSTTDGTAQAAAVVAVVDTSGNYTQVASTTTAQQVTLNAADLEWATDTSYNLCVQVVSASGHTSDWSEPVTVYVVEPLTVGISAQSLVVVSEYGVLSLTEMPLTLTVTGAGDGGTTTVAIERAADYRIDRPDESELSGYEGETIALVTQIGDDGITIERDDLIGRFDDGAAYRIVATVSDSFGQSATMTRAFEVHWTHQAVMPEATVTIDSDEAIAKITPAEPEDAAEGDTVDIYRLSIDKPVLIYSGAEFGTTYVDPYPAIGDFGGYRIVYRTVDGDSITADGHLAWLDIDETFGSDDSIIDFGTGRVAVGCNLDIGNSWVKDFQETQYLGGSVQGDWNPGISRSGTVSGAVVVTDDPDTVESMRRLAVYPGICHVRTKEGSSYAADVQVSEDVKQSNGHDVRLISLKITRVDPEGYDAMTLEEWEELHEVE